ncbi:MAG: SagB/ThcOx family dehydrogenase [Desulfobacterales bacterium]|nr:SagB/ThcOx family dehydrogenase [Desulfobacterales bacterium]
MIINKSKEIVKLPAPRFDGNIPVETALSKRRSVRSYAAEALTLAEVSQLLWSAQGITDSRGFRTAPSAGALYPLELYIVAGMVRGIPAGIYKYRPHTHELSKILDGDLRAQLCGAALNQSSVKQAPLVFVFCAVHERITGKYGNRSIQYVYMEVGHASQNVCLQAVSLDLWTLTIGAFYDDRVKTVINAMADEHPLYIMTIGRLKSE